MSRRPNRWDLLGLALVLAFAGAYGALVIGRGDDGPPPAEQLLDPSTDIQLGEEWMGLYFKGDRVGLMHVVKSAREGGGYRYDMETRLRLTAFRTDSPLDMTVGADLSADLTLERFDFAVDAGAAKLGGRGTVDGKTVHMRLDTGGETIERTIELAHAPVLRSNLGPLLSRNALTPGQRLRYHAFDPMTQRDQPIDVEVVGPDRVLVFDQEVEATHIRTTVGGLTLDGWMNHRGEMLRQQMGLGLVAVRETREQARFGLLPAGRAGADLVAATMIPVKGLAYPVGSRRRLRLALSGVDLSAFELEDTRQRLAEGVLTITRETPGPGLLLPVTADGADSAGLAPEALAASLAADGLVQSDHPRIRRQARRVVGDAGDTLAAARRLKDWVHGHLEQRPVPGVPSALDTLSSRVGDCNEHSTLFAALARSVGVPTRIVVGLVYTEQGFGYHAWNEVRVEGGWVSVDPTWDQLPVDVGHVAFLRGGLGEQVRLLPVIGRLRVSLAP